MKQLSDQPPAEREVDIAIIGGGMVGLCLALLLSQQNAGWKILVVEAFNAPAAGSDSAKPDYRPSFDARSTALSQSSREIFEQLGLWQQLSRHVEPIADVHVSDRGHIGSTRMSAAEQGLEALGCVIENPWLGAVLMAAVKKQAQVELIAPARLEKLNVGIGGVSLALSGVEASYRSRLLVVADGAQSATREKLGITCRIKDYGKVGLIANISLEKPHNGIAYERFTDWGPMAMLPLPDLDGSHRSALVWTLAPSQADKLLAASDAEFLAQLQTRFGHRLGALVRVGERFSYPLKQIVATEQVRSSVVVIGNAAHSLHPVAGQGFNLSLRDAAMLADVLVAAHDRGDDIGSLVTLEKYLHRQQLDQRLTMILSDLLPMLFGMKSAPVALARNIGLLALDAVPPLRHRFSRLGMGLETRGVNVRG